MRILIIHTSYTQHGGEDVVVEQEIELLQKQHQVESIFFKNNKGLKGLFQFLFSIWNIKSAITVKNKIKEFKPDIVHLHNWHFASGPLIIRTINKLHIPIVITLHNFRLLCPSATLLYKNQIYLESLNQDFPWKAVKRGIYRNSVIQTFWLAFVVWFHKKIKTWHKVNTYICLADFSTKLYQESKIGIKKNHFTVKPNFTIPKLKVDSFKRENHFLYIGRLCDEKGIELMLEAFKELPYVLHIAGDGNLKKMVLEVSKTHSNIKYLGKIPKQEVEIELQKAKALVFPSIWLEPFGLIIIEAFSNACPVISTNIGAPKSIVSDGENGFLYNVGDYKDLKKKIKKIANLNEQDLKSLEHKAYETYKIKYSSNQQLEYFNEIYKKASAKKHNLNSLKYG